MTKQEKPLYGKEVFQAIGETVAQLDRALQGHRQLQIELVGLNIRRPKAVGQEILLIVKGIDAEGAACVAFHSAFTLGEALRGLEGRLTNGSLNWKLDEYMK